MREVRGGGGVIAKKRDLEGRTIVTALWDRKWDKSRGCWIHDPTLVLDNGRRVSFQTEESDMGDYGTLILISKRQS